MKRGFRLVPLLLLLTLMPVFAQNTPTEQESSPILIVELQTGSLANASEEFVELFNQTDEPYPADELRLQYRSASGQDWLIKSQLEDELQPRGRYLIATDYLAQEADVVNGLGLAAAGGHIRLIELGQMGETVLDSVAWGTAQFAETSPAQAPPAGESLKRILNEDGQFIDTDNDSQDFIVSAIPSPESTPPLIQEDEPVSEPNPQAPSGNDNESAAPKNQTSSNRTYAKLEISELFIDPDKPLTDAEDEFVEIYNPGAEAVDLEGYIIQTGAKYSYDFTLPNITIKAKQYLAFYSLDTGLALSNSGGGARLLAPNKSPLYEAPAYEKAKPDTAWANIGGSWQWTAKATPNAPNAAAVTGPQGNSSSTSASGRTYLNQGRTLAASDDGRNIYDEPPATADNQIDTAVVAGVGAMALLYAGNEYRYDIGNFFHRLKKHFTARRGGGAAA